MGEPSQVCAWLPYSELIGVRGERGEVKHLSTYRRRYSVSSGERKRMRLNLRGVIAYRRCRGGVVGSHAAFCIGAGPFDSGLVELSGMAGRRG